ncbi:uncharacterized protein [Pyrus communis]|uniref:uncharacterized protein n=1 Tax=Pyrus communis TaxID=23211 RepID=UPI0035C0D74A
MKSPTTLKKIQSLTERVATLNRFLSWSTNRCKPFFKAIKRAQREKWDEECEKAFQDLKKYLTSPPLLSKPETAEDLYIYLAVSEVAVSFALIREELGTTDASQRVMKWALELGQYGLVFRPRTMIKAQALVDFIAEFALSLGDATKQPSNTPEAVEHALAMLASPSEDFWHLHVDSTSNYKGLGAGVVLVLDGSILEQVITLGLKTSNNKAEYEALLAGLRMAKDLAVKKLAIHFDSQLITSQVTGEYTATSNDGAIPRESTPAA